MSLSRRKLLVPACLNLVRCSSNCCESDTTVYAAYTDSRGRTKHNASRRVFISPPVGRRGD